MLRNGNISGSELRDKIELYSELTGQDGWNVPITKVADFMSGFEMGREKFKTRGHWLDNPIKWVCSNCKRNNSSKTNYCPDCGAYMKGEDQ